MVNEGNVLFNDALNNFYCGYMVSDIQIARGNLLPLLYGLLFPISSKGISIGYALSQIG